MLTLSKFRPYSCGLRYGSEYEREPGFRKKPNGLKAKTPNMNIQVAIRDLSSMPLISNIGPSFPEVGESEEKYQYKLTIKRKGADIVKCNLFSFPINYCS